MVFLFCCNIIYAQTPDIGKEIEELKQGQQAIQKKLQDIESLLEKIATQPPMRLAPTSGPVIKDVLNTAIWRLRRSWESTPYPASSSDVLIPPIPKR